MSTWRGEADPVLTPPGARGWLRVLRRGVPMALLTFGGLLLLLLLRGPERLAFGLARPWTGRLTRAVCRANLWLMGVSVTVTGAPMAGPGAIVANHAGWLDIFVLNAVERVFFVAKAEVAGWPGIGVLARATGTIFIQRDPRQAQAQTAMFEDRLRAGQRLLFFPEGTSTDTRRVLPFKPTLFEAFFAPGLGPIRIQPVTLRYTAPPSADPRFYGWWGGMTFGGHFLAVLAAKRQGRVEVTLHPPLAVTAFPGRKALALAAENAVRSGLEGAVTSPR